MAPSPESTPQVTPDGEIIISKEFLKIALEKEANGTPIPEIGSYSAVTGTKPGDNYMSLIYSVDVTLENGKTRHLLMKCYSNHPSRQQFTNNSNMFFKECEVYSKWIPELRRLQTEVLGLDEDQAVKLPYVNFVHGECIDFQSPEGEARKSELIQSLDNFIIMEDVRKMHGFRMTNRREPMDIDHMRLVVEAFARTHSLSWAYRHNVEPNITGKFPCLVTNIKEEDIALWSHVLNANLNQAKEVYDKEFGPGSDFSAAADKFRGHMGIVESIILGKREGEQGLEKLFRIPNPDSKKFGKDSENPEPWRIICHGDCNVNNLLFRYDPDTKKPVEIILVDLQMPQETCVVNDLQYAIQACTDLDFRRAHIDELLQLYHDTFNGVCKLLKTPTLPGFNMDSLRFRYHRGKLYGYYMAMLCLPVMLLDEEKAFNLEDMDAGKDVADAFNELSSGFGANPRIKERLIGATQGMIEDGVF